MFNSRNSIYRDPVGAIAKGETIHFKISPERSLSCRDAKLIILSDNSTAITENMYWCGMNGENKEWWECHFKPKETGVYFYFFELQTSQGHRHLYKDIGGEGVLSNSQNKWQITVYDKGFTTPDWLNGGIIYQIFPDRFNYSRKEKSDIPYGRWLRDDWGNVPKWWPDDDGEISNSDYFKGDLKGIEEKLSYLQSLGVTCIYLNPIFEAHSNHRYNTANYMKIDPLLGDENDFKELCDKAQTFGIKVVLDGVFSHTGSDSVYFNKEGRYDNVGAYNSMSSPYYPWYSFRKYNNDYECWWNFITLPNIREDNPEYINYICGEKGVVRNWIDKGASGWRLDVADELPDIILDEIYKSTKKENPQAIVMGEVWEDASSKMAYGVRRRYLLGKQMDTVMNYPFANAIFRFLNGDHASQAMEEIELIVENYPPQCLKLLMNHIGTHDTERALTVLGAQPLYGRDRKWQSEQNLSGQAYEKAVLKLKLASFLQYFLPGVPCIYYGDEAGLQGYRDPFNRGCYPWGSENTELVKWYQNLGKLRKSLDILKTSSMKNTYSHRDLMCFERFEIDENGEKNSIFIFVNRSEKNEKVPLKFKKVTDVFGTKYADQFILPAFGYSVIKAELV
ncbi:MAG: glycoside hydrolase family 13 protein [Clostridia bacterium]